MPNYHHTVYQKATPFRDFTRIRLAGDTKRMEIKELRRKALREWIDRHYGGVVLRFAEAVGKSQSQIADTLDGRKSFGEKVAKSLEDAATAAIGGKDRLHLVTPEVGGVREPTQSYHGVQLTRAGALLAAEWEKLDVVDRARRFRRGSPFRVKHR